MKGIIISAAAGVLLLAAGSAHANLVSGPNPDFNPYLGASGSSGSTYSGVAELLIARPDLGSGVVEGCAGTLLAGGISILTSAHCIADANGVERATVAYVTFTTADGTYTTQAESFHVDPAYDGSATNPSDVAVLTLVAPAPADVSRYGLYAGDPSDEVTTLAGQGSGTLREGANHNDRTDDLTLDLGESSLDKPSIAPGEVDGFSFIDGEVASVSSFVTLASGKLLSTDEVLNSRFEMSATGSSVAFNLPFIESAMVLAAPEPKLMILLGAALVAVSLAGDKRKHH